MVLVPLRCLTSEKTDGVARGADRCIFGTDEIAILIELKTVGQGKKSAQWKTHRGMCKQMVVQHCLHMSGGEGVTVQIPALS